MLEHENATMCGACNPPGPMQKIYLYIKINAKQCYKVVSLVSSQVDNFKLSYSIYQQISETSQADLDNYVD